MHNPHRDRSLPIAAIGGAILLFVGTWLHPMRADPNVPLAAFTEYAADRNWIASHLMQLAGVALMVTSLILLSRIMAGGTAETAAFLGSCGAIASLAVAAVLQAVDGVALKAMVNAWAAAPTREKEMLFSAAFAVRQIEIGLASVTALLSGLTTVLKRKTLDFRALSHSSGKGAADFFAERRALNSRRFAREVSQFCAYDTSQMGRTLTRIG
jgi:hypothetical protein